MYIFIRFSPTAGKKGEKCIFINNNQNQNIYLEQKNVHIKAIEKDVWKIQEEE